MPSRECRSRLGRCVEWESYVGRAAGLLICEEGREAEAQPGKGMGGDNWRGRLGA